MIIGVRMRWRGLNSERKWTPNKILKIIRYCQIEKLALYRQKKRDQLFQ